MSVLVVLALIGVALVLFCAVAILAGWRSPDSRFIAGMLQTRSPRSSHPERDAASACWLVFAFAVACPGFLYALDLGGDLRSDPADRIVGGLTVLACGACVAVAGWVRWGDAPPSLRPVALQDSPHGPTGD